MIPKTRMIRHLYQTEFACFLELAFRALHPNTDYVDHWSTRILADHLERCCRGESKRLIINMPPRYLKSMATSIALPAWVLAHHPEAKILCVAGTMGLANAQHVETKELMTHPRYRVVFPHVQVQEKGRSLRLAHGGSRSGFTPTGGIAGRGADFIIIDDPLTTSSAENEHLRTYINEWYDQNIHQRLDNKSNGVVIVVMQRLHVDDLTAHLLRRDGWDLLRLPAIATEDETYPRLYGDRILRREGEPLNTGLESRGQLREAMLSVGAKNFMAQYQQAPYPPVKGEGRAGYYSPLREGVEWTPDQGSPTGFFTQVSEEKILLHTVFGEGEHPWPPDMRSSLTMSEWVIFNELVMKWQANRGWETGRPSI